MTMLKHETHLRCRVNISLVGIMPERYISQTSLNLRIIHNNLGPIFMLGLPTTPSAIISMCMSKYPRADHGDNVQISFCRASICSAWLSNLWLVDICWIFYNKLSFVDQKQWSSDQSILITMLMLGCHWLWWQMLAVDITKHIAVTIFMLRGSYWCLDICQGWLNQISPDQSCEDLVILGAKWRDLGRKTFQKNSFKENYPSTQVLTQNWLTPILISQIQSYSASNIRVLWNSLTLPNLNQRLFDYKA